MTERSELSRNGLSRVSKVFLTLREIAAQDKPFGVKDEDFFAALAAKILFHGEHLTGYADPLSDNASAERIAEETGLGVGEVTLDMQSIMNVFTGATAHQKLHDEMRSGFASEELRAAMQTSQEALKGRIDTARAYLRHAPHRNRLDRKFAAKPAAEPGSQA